VPPVIALSGAAVCFLGAWLLYRRRGATLRLMTRVRGFDRARLGPRRRYQEGWSGQLDMALPVMACLLLGAVFLSRGLATLL
jgi:hypothetical protein